MAITVGELQEWIRDTFLTEDELIAIDEGGLSLVRNDEPEFYIEVGGIRGGEDE